MEMEKKEAQDLKAAEARSTCEECGEYGHVRNDCPEEDKTLDYMRKGELLNFRYGQGRPQFNASSSIPNAVPLRIQLKEFMNEQAKINKDTVTKFKTIDKVLENIDSKVTEVGSSNHQVLIVMKMLETQVGQLLMLARGDHVRYQRRKEFIQVPSKNRGMQHDWSEGRTKAKGGAEKEEGADKNERKENQRRCCIHQDKGREAACEDQKND
jgi:hypothetical protein